MCAWEKPIRRQPGKGKLEPMAQENEKANAAKQQAAEQQEASQLSADEQNVPTANLEQDAEPPANTETAQTPSDEDLFVGQVTEELSDRQLFAGDEDFYRFLAKSTQAINDESKFAAAAQKLLPIIPTRNRNLSATQKILVAGIVLIAAVLLYGFLKSPSKLVISIAPATQTGHRPQPAANQQAPGELSVPEPGAGEQSIPQQIQAAFATPGVDSIPPEQPLSLKIAETFYRQADYDKAYAAYFKLYQALEKTTDQKLIKDFLQLRMALCLQSRQNLEPAARMFKAVGRSDSPVVRTLANYHLSFIQMQEKHYLQARTRAYKTIALVDALDFDPDWAQSVRRNCHFLVAELMTRNVLTLCDADKDISKELWSRSEIDDPFASLDEKALHAVLQSGRELFSKALLGPQIKRLMNHNPPLPDQHQDNTQPLPESRWSVICHGAPIDELFARFAANAALDIHWVFSNKSAAEQIDSVIRHRPVSLTLSAATTQQIAAVAAGSAGLLAQLDDNAVVNVYNPLEYASLSKHIDLLRDEALSLWQTFLIAYYNDKRIANAHFALGILQAQKDLIAPAIAEYKIVANRFSESPLAPLALLNSSKLKTNMRDYAGAREDLKQLVEQYPGTEIAGRACLYLADATMKANLYDDAAKLYRKVYNLALSPESQTVSANRAGFCFYQKRDYKTAAKWLNRYIELARDNKTSDLYSAYLLLGKTSLKLGNPRQACDAFRLALAGQLPREQYVQAILAAVTGYIRQQNFITALNLLDNVQSWRLSQAESVDLLLLKTRILRTMGLEDKALAQLADRAEYISDEQLKGRILLQIAMCHIAKGELEIAHKNLAQILVQAEPGPFAHEVAFEFAGLCLKLGRNAQAVSVCSQLLELQISPQIKHKTLDILARAYKKQKKYDKAASTLLTQLDS